MAPKKLTDCPENLREAIDWLIQVRHGDGNGLEQLAKALKKLIEEAIEKAYTTNVSALLKALDSAKSYKCCKDKVAEVEKLRDSKNLSSKTFENLKSKCEGIKNCTKNHLDDSQQKAYDGITSKFEQLKKLEESLNIFTSKDTTDGCKKLLENLCDGLEKFLGFNSTSKGYDGTGIVYSDLDRLCDGVMGFLSGVLKDVSEKQPYSVGKNDLKHFVETELKTKLSTGREGFKVIEQVARKVREYNERVRQSNEKVKEPINAMLSEMNDYKNNALRSKLPDENLDDYKATDNAVSKADTLVHECVEKSIALENALTVAHENVLDLNHELKVKIIDAKNSVTHERERLTKLSRKQWKDMVDMKNEICNMLEYLKAEFNVRIDDDITSLVEKLKASVRIIKEKLMDINDKLIHSVKQMEEWMDEVITSINEARNQHVSKILGEASGGENTRKGHIKNITKKVSQEFQEAEAYVKALVGVALAQVKSLNDGLRFDLEEVRNQMNENIGGYVKEYVEKVRGELNKITNPYTGIDAIEKSLKQWAGDYDDKNFENRIVDWLADILQNSEVVKEKLSEYFLTVKTKVRNDFFNSDYITQENTINDGQIRVIANLIKDSLGSDFGVLGQLVTEQIRSAEKSNDKIRGYIEAVKTGIEFFVQDIERNIKQGKDEKPMSTGIYALADKIAKAIENKVRNTAGTSNSAYVINMINAVTPILHQLLAIANEKATYLKWLTGKGSKQGNIGYVDDALKVALNLNAKLTIALLRNGDSGYEDTKAFVRRSPVQNQLEANVEKTIVEALNGKIGTSNASKVNLSNLFNQFRQRITAAVDDRNKLNGTEEEGTLPKAIGAIELYGLDKLGKRLNGNPNVDGESIGFLEQIRRHLNAFAKEFDTCGRYIDAHLHNLKTDRIGNVLNAIRNNLDALQRDNLYTVIQDVNRFLTTDANELKTQTILQLKSYVTNQLNSTSISLTHLSQKQYVTSIKYMLNAFSTKVRNELHQLPEAIESDLDIGFKGFMNAIEGEATKNIQKLQYAVDLRSLCHGFEAFFLPLKKFIDSEIKRVHENNNLQKNPNPLEPESTYTTKINRIYSALSTLIGHIITTNRYDHKIPGMLSNLMDAVNTLKPQSFEQGNTPILDGVTDGLGKFVDEMRKAYMSRYDGAKAITWDGTFTNKEPEESKNAKKICLTVFYTLFHNLHPLFYKASTDWRTQKIQGGENNMHLRKFIEDLGYDVANLITRDDIGWNVAVRLGKHFQKHGEFNEDPGKHKSFDKYIGYYKNKGVISKLFSHLNDYYYVCHLAPAKSPKQPCNIFQMLAWLCGLTYNSVYGDLSLNGFGGLFEESKQEEEADPDGISLKVDDDETLSAYPEDITGTKLRDSLTAVCHSAYDVLTAVLGHGHNDGVYASDYFNNNLNLSYPTSGSACLDMLVDILHRVHHQMGFLLKQCLNGPDSSGWKDCWYGRGVGGSSWRCNTWQCPKQIDGQACTQIANQRADQTCNQHASCGLKSPLQSFLEDGLAGFLPHKITKPGCKLDCAVSNHRGLPCKTPMGFADISVKASHTKKGSHLIELLTGFCGKRDSPLVNLCAQLTCLMQRVPQTLDDMFSFYSNLLKDWNKNDTHRRLAFDNAVTKAYLNQLYDALQVDSIFSGGHSINHAKGDLFSLTCGTDSLSKSHCGRYLQPFSMNTWSVFSEKNADRYLTWITYLTETFYVLLKNIYDECCKNCATPGSRCYEKTCYKNCVVSQSAEHHDKCKSIAACNFTRPTLCKYGFVLKSSSNLSGTNGNKTKRTCQDFCKTLKDVLQEDRVLFILAYKTIPEFLFTIRAPFIWLNVALWLLSLLYLICVMIGRLDVLHIKSHLRSPSSHRIAAQSLLAAARVGKLSKIWYLQA
ncbi:hypothetical protein BBBOND_0300080 [Babesia bigemina]|uniref:C3H1-type domain-containing protein n=1 Tax=Babesia bigemina TaxID=5866 RepID=A0A061D6C1_BABBI|nr:hypothetical protein BBBOND_0300080 [Babesia bigemina]CDR96103.1 hypothetical protein BBBOND_0300080 [Babesia bigemina]|eukprot:XP_012768289.1 hypothetical protein BBBOND_0300080 [Babesia bigemina]